MSGSPSNAEHTSDQPPSSPFSLKPISKSGKSSTPQPPNTTSQPPKPDQDPSSENKDASPDQPSEPSAADAASLANAVAVAIKESTPAKDGDKTASSESPTGDQPPGKSRGRGGDRPANAPAVQQGHVIDPTNPYLVVHPPGPHTYPGFHPGMPGPPVHPGFPAGMVHHNPYMMFPPMMHGRPGHMMQVPIHLPPHLDMSQYQQGAAQAANGANATPGTNGEGSNANGEGGEAATNPDGTPAATAPTGHPGPYPPGFHQLAHAFHPPTDQNGQPLPYHHLLPTLHHPHGPPGTAIQLTLPLAVADHTLPSHLDVLIRAPDSLTITYSEVPDGAYLLRTDFAEVYPKNLEPPRKTTEMRCLFCKRHYSGPNARGMWRRHVTGKHDFMFERKGKDGSGSRRAPLMPGMIGKEDDMDGDMSMSFHEDDGVLDGAQKMDGDDDEAHAEGSRSKPDGQGENPEAHPVMGGGMPHGDMSMVSLNGMPIHPMGMHMSGYPPGHGPPMQIPMQMHMLGNPPHPMMVPAAPPERRKTKPRASGVGLGNGGGGLVPRVHPLLTKEERIERARASKRHYAMKRRAMEKMKAGGIPKGARLVDGVFILADGTQIPAEPGKIYTDLSTHHIGGSSKRGAAEGDGTDDDAPDNEPLPKRPRRASKKKGEQETEHKDDDDDEQVDAELGDVSMVTAGEEEDHEGLVSMDQSMDPWGDNPAVFQANAIPAPVNQTPINPTTGLPWNGKLAEVPFVTRGYKPPPMQVDPKLAAAPMSTSSVPALEVPVLPPPIPVPQPVPQPTQEAPASSPAPEPTEQPAPDADEAPSSIAAAGDLGTRRRRGRPTNAAREAAAALAAEKAEKASKRREKRLAKKIAAKQQAEKEDEEDEIDEDDDEDMNEGAQASANEEPNTSITSVPAQTEDAPQEQATAPAPTADQPATASEPVVAQDVSPPARRVSTRERTAPRRVSVRGKAAAAANAAAAASSSEAHEGDSAENAGAEGASLSVSPKTRRREGGPGPSGNGNDRTFCYCEDHEYGNMIGCDNPNCPREWFHLACTDIQGPIPSTWYCKDCRGETADIAGELPVTEAQDAPAETDIKKSKTKAAGETRGRGRGRGRGRARGRGAPASSGRQEAESEPAPPPSKETPTKPTSARGRSKRNKAKTGKDKPGSTSLPLEPESEDEVYESEDQTGVDISTSETAAPETSTVNVDEDYDEAEETHETPVNTDNRADPIEADATVNAKPDVPAVVA